MFEADNNSHCHWVQIVTSGDVSMENHKHTHYISGKTNIVQGHYHTFTQITTLGDEIYLTAEGEGENSLQQKTCKYKYNPVEDEEA